MRRLQDWWDSFVSVLIVAYKIFLDWLAFPSEIPPPPRAYAYDVKSAYPNAVRALAFCDHCKKAVRVYSDECPLCHLPFANLRS